MAVLFWSSVRMDQQAVLTAFDEQVRRHPEPSPGGHVEHDDLVVRAIDTDDGWTGVTWCGLGDADVDEVIAAQIRYFTELRLPWEWKHYSYDQPENLPDRLFAAGFEAEPAETVLVAEIAELRFDGPPPPGVELVAVDAAQRVEAFVAVHNEVFGGDHSGVGRALLDGVARKTEVGVAVLAVAEGTAISAGRLEFHRGTEFASLWGGGTVPKWRSRGVFRSLVAHRAALAAARGFRYLQVDATPDSEPILRRLGFERLATTTPFTHSCGATRT